MGLTLFDWLVILVALIALPRSSQPCGSSSQGTGVAPASREDKQNTPAGLLRDLDTKTPAPGIV